MPEAARPPKEPAWAVGSVPASLISRNPTAWLALFGPGAIMASLTIGSGELIFSSRGGAIFGYRLLWSFSLVLILKWALVFATARHMILSGAHPLQRWMDLPGPRGWLPIVFLLLGLACFPIWVSFHAGTVGTLLAALTGTEGIANGGGHFVWGGAVLVAVLGLALTGGYSRLERVQIGIVILMLFSVVVSLFLLKPDWWELLKGLLVPQAIVYPDWIAGDARFANRPVWGEAMTYVGVVGGSGYDYLAYTSYLRDKRWGLAGSRIVGREELGGLNGERIRSLRLWVRAPLIDCTLSFAAVLLFSAVFVACGAVILEPQHRVPAGTTLLTLQAEFVTGNFPWLRWVYFLGAFLAMLGTLYGTIEVAPTVVRELRGLWNGDRSPERDQTVRRLTIAWVGGGALLVLAGSLVYCLKNEAGGTPPGLVAILTPANLFTGVLACGLICLTSPWSDRRFLPEALRMHWGLSGLNLLAGVGFLALGLKAYWDHSGWVAYSILLGTVSVGWVAAWFLGRRER